MSMSMSTCRAQYDSLQENPMLVALGKGDGKCVCVCVEGGGIREGRHEGGKEGRGMRDHKIENRCDFSCRRKKAMSFAW